MMFHQAVLLKESIDGLAIRPDGIYVDVTFGGGGHSAEILKQLTTGKLFAFDQDQEALENAIPDPRITMIKSNFKYIRNFLKLYKAVPVDGILADLGTSSHQIDDPGRGFSTRFEGELDMRMDRSKSLSARQVINSYPEERLSVMFHEYAELSQSRKIARMIATARRDKEIVTTADLKELLQPCAERGRENKFFAQVFQAIRIETNQEIDVLKELLTQGLDLLKPGGRMVILSYHSLEDRLVKNFFKSGNFAGNIEKDFYGNRVVPFTMISHKPMMAGEEELLSNSRARSVRLRIAEKK
jgi:16S rRNA (cytosine1402-N4)-methyltransferase